MLVMTIMITITMTMMMIIIYKITMCVGYVKLIQSGAIFYHLMAFKKTSVLND